MVSRRDEVAPDRYLVSLEQLRAAYDELRRSRTETSVARRAKGDRDRYERACRELSRLTRSAYEQGEIRPDRIRRTTGLRRDESGERGSCGG